MKLQILAACAALATLSAGSALADETITAKLPTPVAAKVKVIAGGAMFNCEADTCVAASPASSTYAISTCKIIAGKFGPVVSFEGRKSLDEGKLSDCNAKAVAKAAGTTTLAKQ